MGGSRRLSPPRVSASRYLREGAVLLALLALGACSESDLGLECEPVNPTSVPAVEAHRCRPTGEDVPLTLFRCEAHNGTWAAWVDWDGLEDLSGRPGGFSCEASPWFDSEAPE